jgi:hypothetical protein
MDVSTELSARDGDLLGLEAVGRRLYARIDEGLTVYEVDDAAARRVQHWSFGGPVTGLDATGDVMAVANFERIPRPGLSSGYRYSLDLLSTAGEGLRPVGELDLTPCGISEHVRWLPDFGVAIHGGLAYLTDSACGLHVVDVTPATEPVLLGGTEPDVLELFSAPVVQEGYAYAVDYQGLAVFDVRDARAPRLAATSHWPISDPLPNQGRILAVGASRAYVLDRGGLQVVDVGRPERPRYLGRIPTAGRPASMILDDGILYAADSEGGLVLLDPGAPTVDGPAPAPTESPVPPTPTPVRTGFKVLLPRLHHSAGSP